MMGARQRARRRASEVEESKNGLGVEIVSSIIHTRKGLKRQGPISGALETYVIGYVRLICPLL